MIFKHDKHNNHELFKGKCSGFLLIRDLLETVKHDVVKLRITSVDLIKCGLYSKL